MPIDILMPALSPTMTEGKLAAWMVKEGDSVSSGDVIAEIETDKATMEVEAVDEGVVAKILVPEGSEGVAVNSVIARLLEESEDASALDAPAVAQPPSAAVTPAAAPEVTPASASAGPQSSAPAPAGDDKAERVFASPLARRIAADKGLDLAQVTGSGPHGRIVKADVINLEATAQKAVATPSSASASKPTSQTTTSLPGVMDPRPIADAFGLEYDYEPATAMRKVIAQRLTESKQSVPHFYLTLECNIDPLLALRKQINQDSDGSYKLSVNDFIIKAAAKALQQVPAANASWTGDGIIRYKSAHISVAVAIDGGLITPVVREAEKLSLGNISNKVKDLAGRAKEGKLTPAEFQGGTFSISNLGMFGIQQFQAVINPPEGAILAVGAGEQKPVVVDGEVTIQTCMTVTLSCDHRVVDGAVGAEFLAAFKQIIEAPTRLLV